MSSIESRLQKLERIQAKKPPTDLFGKYFDSLARKDRVRYLKYIYQDDYVNLESAERIESQAQNTLHFICSSKETDFDLDGDIFKIITRKLELNI